MSMSYIRKTYGVPAKRGGRISFTDAKYAAKGTIVGSRGQYLRVRMDGGDRVITLHPEWHVVYLDKNMVSQG